MSRVSKSPNFSHLKPEIAQLVNIFFMFSTKIFGARMLSLQGEIIIKIADVVLFNR